MYVIIVTLLSSIGAFFHFLLNHEISIVEAWLHNNKWEILIVSKLLSLFLLHRWFSMRLYHLKSLRSLINELMTWPESKALVVPMFMTASYLTLAKVLIAPQNLGYWYFYFVSFAGLFLFFGIEFIVMAHLEDVLNQKEKPRRLQLGIFYTLIFAAAFKLSVPDYYGLLPFVIFSFSTLLYLSGNSFSNWSNVICFLLLFVAPMGCFFGLDPIWGNDFSPFKVERNLGLTFLAIIWMISFGYYKFRDQLMSSAVRFLRR
jgi:hypothetical protein